MVKFDLSSDTAAGWEWVDWNDKRWWYFQCSHQLFSRPAAMVDH